MKDPTLQIALKVFEDPMRATMDDAEKLARGYLLKATGKLPPRKRRA